MPRRWWILRDHGQDDLHHPGLADSHPSEREAYSRWRGLTRFAPPPAAGAVLFLMAMAWWTAALLGMWPRLPGAWARAMPAVVGAAITNPIMLAALVAGLPAVFQVVYSAFAAAAVRGAFAPRDRARRAELAVLPGFAEGAARAMTDMLREARLPYAAAYVSAAFIAGLPLLGAFRIASMYGAGAVSVDALAPGFILGSSMALWPGAVAAWARAVALRETGAPWRAAAATAAYAGLWIGCWFLNRVIPARWTGYDASRAPMLGLLALNVSVLALLYAAGRRRATVDLEVHHWADRLAGEA